MSKLYYKRGHNPQQNIMLLKNINNQMNAMLEVLKPRTPNIDLNGREWELAMKEAEAQKNDPKIQAENEWINQQDRIFDAQQ